MAGLLFACVEAVQAQTVVPVSYTHLDVYKRQDEHGVDQKDLAAVVQNLCSRGIKKLMITLGRDVYKRQDRSQ